MERRVKDTEYEFEILVVFVHSLLLCTFLYITKAFINDFLLLD